MGTSLLKRKFILPILVMLLIALLVFSNNEDSLKSSSQTPHNIGVEDFKFGLGDHTLMDSILQLNLKIVKVVGLNGEKDEIIKGLQKSNDLANSQAKNMETQIKKLSTDVSNREATIFYLKGEILRLQTDSLKADNKIVELSNDDKRKSAKNDSLIRVKQKEYLKYFSEISNIKSQKDSVDKLLLKRKNDYDLANKELIRKNAEIAKAENAIKEGEEKYKKLKNNLGTFFCAVITIIAWFIGTFLTVLVVYTIYFIFKNKKHFRSKNNFLLLDEGMKNYEYYSDISASIRFVLVLSFLLTATIVLIIIIFLLFAEDEGRSNFIILANEQFWKAISTIAFPLIFIATIYNFVESKRIEVFKLLRETQG